MCVPGGGPPGLRMALGQLWQMREWGAVWSPCTGAGGGTTMHWGRVTMPGGGAEGQQVMGWFNLERCVTSQPLHHLTVASERCSSQKCCSYRVTIWRRVGLAGAADNIILCIFMYTPPPQ